MIGFPKSLNSKADYLYIRDNFHREKWLPFFQALLDEQTAWFNVGVVSVNTGINDATHKTVTQEMEGVTTVYQYELKPNPACKLNQLGFTVAEANSLIGIK